MIDCQCIDLHKFTIPWLAFECLSYFLGLGHHDHPIQHCLKKKTYQAIWRIMFLLGRVTSFGVPCEFYNSIIYLVLSGWNPDTDLMCYCATLAETGACYHSVATSAIGDHPPKGCQGCVSQGLHGCGHMDSSMILIPIFLAKKWETSATKTCNFM